MRKFLALLFALLLCTATKVYAEDTATVTVTVKDLPQKLQNRTVIVTLGNGPSDTESTVIVLDGLNNYTETVTVVPSEYYCAAAVQYDALGDYPLQEINQTTFLQAEGGNHYDLIYTLAGSSWYESVTGQQRHYTLQPLAQLLNVLKQQLVPGGTTGARTSTGRSLSDCADWFFPTRDSLLAEFVH